MDPSGMFGSPEPSRLEQGAPPTAEWILDNEYVIESNARTFAEPSSRFYQELPAPQ